MMWIKMTHMASSKIYFLIILFALYAIDICMLPIIDYIVSILFKNYPEYEIFSFLLCIFLHINIIFTLYILKSQKFNLHWKATPSKHSSFNLYILIANFYDSEIHEGKVPLGIWICVRNSNNCWIFLNFSKIRNVFLWKLALLGEQIEK